MQSFINIRLLGTHPGTELHHDTFCTVQLRQVQDSGVISPGCCKLAIARLACKKPVKLWTSTKNAAMQRAPATFLVTTLVQNLLLMHHAKRTPSERCNALDGLVSSPCNSPNIFHDVQTCTTRI